MSTYYFEVSVGGTSVIKVEADDEETAETAAETFFLEDWNEAGPLKYGDVHVEPYPPERITLPDASIIALGNGTAFGVAEDDPRHI